MPMFDQYTHLPWVYWAVCNCVLEDTDWRAVEVVERASTTSWEDVTEVALEVNLSCCQVQEPCKVYPNGIIPVYDIEFSTANLVRCSCLEFLKP